MGKSILSLTVSLLIGVLAYVVGMAAAAVLVVVLYLGTGSGPRGGDMLFKAAWSAAVFALGPMGAAAFSAGWSSRWHLGPWVYVPAALAALIFYGLTVWGLAEPLTVINDCAVGVTWPVASVPGCD